MSKVLITTVPFAEINQKPLELLNQAGIHYKINPLQKKLTEDDLASMISDYDMLIAGTEPITSKVLKRAKNLKLISRVGIGLDNVDLKIAKELGIKVSYTPDAPSPAVAELTISLILVLLRQIHISNEQLHLGKWHRFFGQRLSNMTIGVIGVGRIGKKVLSHLKGFGSPKVLANDISNQANKISYDNIKWVDKEEIYEKADIITLHIPLTKLTKNMICKEQILLMKKNAILINTSRGGIINEKDLYNCLLKNHLKGAGIDVYEEEPYDGPLKHLTNCLMTAHLGSMTEDCRNQMEIEATQEIINFYSGKSLLNEVPQKEYNF